MRRSHDTLACDEFLTILESISDGVFAVNEDLQIVFLNAAAKRFTGYAAVEAIGQLCQKVLNSNICNESCALRQTMATGEAVVNRPVCLTNKSGKRVPISILTALLRDGQGRVIRGVETFRDLDLVERLPREYEGKHSFENIVRQS
ncbi:MAG: PAS domain-containing protein [Candidatus Zixiibacteriota bacterium]|jgi:PAS domain S-box-containing protein